MLTKLSLFLCVVCAIFLLGCAKTETGTVSADKIGVPECDEFIANYDACISSKVPEVARAQYKTTIEQWRTSWKKLAENPQTKPSLAAACKQSAEQARASMKTYNCTF
jgi:hypothetical protein